MVLDHTTDVLSMAGRKEGRKGVLSIDAPGRIYVILVDVVDYVAAYIQFVAVVDVQSHTACVLGPY